MQPISLFILFVFCVISMCELISSSDKPIQLDSNVNSLGVLIYQGAEARVYRSQIFHSCNSWPCIIKERFVKRYRHPDLDCALSAQRMRAEVRQLLRCREVGIDVPPILLVDNRNRRIWLGEVGPNAVTLHGWFQKFFSHVSMSNSGDISIKANLVIELRNLCLSIGRLLAQFHANHIIHGDLTMANILVCKKNKVEQTGEDEIRLVPIDFGLSTSVPASASQRLAEEKAVDLYVFERALVCGMDHKALATIAVNNTDISTPECIVNLILDSYEKSYIIEASEQRKCDKDIKNGSSGLNVVVSAEVKDILKRLNEVRLRGRKRLMVG